MRRDSRNAERTVSPGTVTAALVAPRAGFLFIQCPKLLPVIHNNTPNKTGSSG